MTSSVDDAYEKYVLKGPDTEETESHVDCLKCGSHEVDRSYGYRGEYKCLTCGHSWQVGGINAS